MINEVNVKDREKEIEYLRMALAVAEFGVSYEHADLINQIVNKVQTVGGSFDLEDGCKIFFEWKEKWEKYYTEQDNKPKP